MALAPNTNGALVLPGAGPTSQHTPPPESSTDSDETALGPTYSGEDIRPTSDKELRAWYAYAWAAEPYVVVAIATFIPLTLEALARENGHLLGQPDVPCTPKSFPIPIPGPEPGPPHTLPKTPTAFFRPDPNQCIIHLLGIRMASSSFAMYTFSISVLLQSLVIVSMSGAADHGSYRKKLLLFFAALGSVSTMLFIVVKPGAYPLAALWTILSNVSFGASFVLLNAFLPVLVRNHPTVQAQLKSSLLDVEPDSESAPTENTALLSSTSTPPPSVTASALGLSTKISSTGVAIGYLAGAFLQALAIFVIRAFSSSPIFGLEVILFIVGAWWAGFSIFVALWMRPRPGPPLPRVDAKPGDPVDERIGWDAVAYAWKKLWRTIRLAGQLKDVMLFLAAWFCMSDGIATVTSTAVLFSKTELHMEPASLAFMSVIGMACGISGALLWPVISRLSWLNLTPPRTVLLCVSMMACVPAYGLLGFLPIVKQMGWGGLTHPAEMYGVGAVYGFAMSGVSAYARSVFGELIPPGSESALFALYAITDKGSSVFGPAIAGFITDKTGNIRYAFWFLLVLLLIPLPLLGMIDVQRGKRDSRKASLDALVTPTDQGIANLGH
ncbi:Autophagy-related protein 22-1 OS=Penicillium chrysogenum (strain ATCC 28089 / DSM 1075 / Wisconsin 54-1255) GN=atg22-1 PE=3 SV=1 [Rhizoctonia solani AG-1 IB]|uniref:Autophagy-related protein n=1 Tax=Thanatephorus cucumeris (strain AG1-IB / isolate 7/3/14) TaxID=1108050 RepID=A0A0B7FP39_THACB|nr:Autophagy-related protein 22-1 OS=Penicillium chrysogenum (strain ATCC 28089 / DSM 1075 / Wisconsin 54-1255) GN=atg22-1 PE=3 SV=1 [Rhizoctonia solani AG-1 IB]